MFETRIKIEFFLTNSSYIWGGNRINFIQVYWLLYRLHCIIILFQRNHQPMCLSINFFHSVLPFWLLFHVKLDYIVNWSSLQIWLFNAIIFIRRACGKLLLFEFVVILAFVYVIIFNVFCVKMSCVQFWWKQKNKHEFCAWLFS